MERETRAMKRTQFAFAWVRWFLWVALLLFVVYCVAYFVVTGDWLSHSDPGEGLP